MLSTPFFTIVCRIGSLRLIYMISGQTGFYLQNVEIFSSEKWILLRFLSCTLSPAALSHSEIGHIFLVIPVGLKYVYQKFLVFFVFYINETVFCRFLTFYWLTLPLTISYMWIKYSDCPSLLPLSHHHQLPHLLPEVAFPDPWLVLSFTVPLVYSGPSVWTLG